VARKRKPSERDVAVGRRIAKLRRAAGLTQEELARKINVSHDAVRKWETGRREPGLHMAEKLARALRCSIDDLCGYKPPPKEES
jgi:transcriptional regulator with XRE-family HTH domain